MVCFNPRPRAKDDLADDNGPTRLCLANNAVRRKVAMMHVMKNTFACLLLLYLSAFPLTAQSQKNLYQRH
jgi:hypothetical protein